MKYSNIGILIIDMQVNFVNEIQDPNLVIENQIQFIENHPNIPIFLIESDYERFGPTENDLKYNIFKNNFKEKIIKPENDAFFKTSLDDYLKQSEIKELILFGIYTSRCVIETAITAIQKQYSVIIYKNCIADRYNRDKQTLNEALNWFNQNCQVF